MYLPALRQPVGPVDATGAGTILLVDDNDAFRTVIRNFLQASRYTVLEARSASEAATIASKHRGTIDLLLTDVVLPGANGDQLGDYLRFLSPQITILYMSGYGSTAQFGSVGSQTGAHMLPKPFSKRTLLLAVAQLLHWQEYKADLFPSPCVWRGFTNSVRPLA
jgi:two-component system, cell cycle sensor histidine kinase and response regulator CckA